MDQTTNLNLPIPNADAVPPTNISAEFPRIALALTMLDEIIHTLQGVVAGKAETDHAQAISTITGLVEALAGKMPADTSFSLDDLQDVMGAADALVNYVLVKNASGFWVPSTALAALGVHNHAISEVVGLADLLEDMSDALDFLASRTVTGAGLATGGGDLSANPVITVTKATDAEAAARVRDDVAVSPKGAGLAAAAYNKWETIQLIDMAGLSQAIVTNLGAFRRIRLSGEFRPSIDANSLALQLSQNNGVSFVGGATDYYNQYAGVVNATYAGGASVSTGYFLVYNSGNGSATGSSFSVEIAAFNRLSSKSLTGHLSYIDAASGTQSYILGGSRNGSNLSNAANAIRIFPATGTIAEGFIHIEGIRV